MDKESKWASTSAGGRRRQCGRGERDGGSTRALLQAQPLRQSWHKAQAAGDAHRWVGGAGSMDLEGGLAADGRDGRHERRLRGARLSQRLDELLALVVSVALTLVRDDVVPRPGLTQSARLANEADHIIGENDRVQGAVGQIDERLGHRDEEVFHGNGLALGRDDEPHKRLKKAGRLAVLGGPVFLEVNVGDHGDRPGGWARQVEQLHVGKGRAGIGGEDAGIDAPGGGCPDIRRGRLEEDAVEVLQRDLGEPAGDAVARVDVSDGIRLGLQVIGHASRALPTDADGPVVGASVGAEGGGAAQSPIGRALFREVGGEAGGGGGALHAMGDLDGGGRSQRRILGQNVRVVPGGDVAGVDARDQARVQGERLAAELRLGDGVEERDGADGDGHVQHLTVVGDQLGEPGRRHRDVARPKVGLSGEV
eukprot:scaffold3758_cov162-Isochrysis_galbana.AAC.2